MATVKPGLPLPDAPDCFVLSPFGFVKALRDDRHRVLIEE